MPPTNDSSDQVWVRVEVCAQFAELLTFSQNPEQLFRLNPYYEIRHWQWQSPEHASVEFYNHSNQQLVKTELVLEPIANGWICHYRSGIKVRTSCEISAEAAGSVLQITEEYADFSDEEKQTRLAEVDKSLNAWAHGIQAYFHSLERFSWLPGWRLYRSTIWLHMKPSARRIVFLLFWMTFADLLLFLVVWAFFLLES